MDDSKKMKKMMMGDGGGWSGKDVGGGSRGAGGGRGAPRVLLTRRDLEAVGWVGEQYAATVDQVAQLLALLGERDRPLDVSHTWRVVNRWQALGLVEAQRILADRRSVVWPTRAGLDLAGHSWPAKRPDLTLLRHTLLVATARIAFARRLPGGVWTSERQLLVATGEAPEQLPDGEVIVDGARCAVEIELARKTATRLDQRLTARAGVYTRTWVFASAGALAGVRGAHVRLQERDEHAAARITVNPVEELTW